MLKRFKKAVNNFLEKLAEENEKSFGKGSLDCCQLNRQSTNNKAGTDLSTVSDKANIGGRP